jgi:DNA-binding NtrC family response regulator
MPKGKSLLLLFFRKEDSLCRRIVTRLLLIGELSGGMAKAASLAQQAGAQIRQADSITAGLAAIRADAGLGLIFCDIVHDISGLTAAMLAERITVPVIATGATLTPHDADAAIRAGARDVLLLPPDPDLLAAILLHAAGQAGAPVVRDPAMLAVLRRAEQVAPSEASVLITGESGTGKEVIARVIHAKSRRAGGPFVALNCAAIPETLLESELFGHEKGAFSGALARRVGKFEAAQNGTLLLDEISEMDIRLQAKLLRAIQEREIDRVGGSAPVRINVRILATSNRDLAAEASAGRFREDLYFRLNVIRLPIPPLRERPADIPALAEHYARHYAVLNGLPDRKIGPDARARLCAHSWRGNVRELENVMHSAVLMATGHEITAEAIDLPHAAAPARSQPAMCFVGRRMEDIERDVILQTLNHMAGNRTHAATVLGISIRALRNKLREYSQSGIPVPPPGVAA